MDSYSCRHESSKPDVMQLQFLKEITDNFSDERILGQGGFGVVYKGVLQNGEMVAVKKLLQPMPNFLKQFKNEIDLLVKLKHPNIVRLIGYCYETQNVHMDYNGKFIFAEVTQSLLCLEFLPKGSLDRYISDESCGLDWCTRYTIIEGICNGLQYLHEQIKPIIHLDLKPANILLTDNMVPKVTDFGLSRLLDQQQTMCTLITTGTRGYMPPEYIQGGTITTMSDIFSLGVIILEIVTGHRDYPDVTRTSSEDFIELTLKKWSDVLEKAPGYTSVEIDCQQIKKCIQIGLICVNPERTKRPTAAKVIKMLQGLESMDCDGGNEVTSSTSQSTSRPREYLDIFPLELCFSSEPDKPSLVKLTNKTDGYVAFHFKATRAINKYCIEPASGFLWPRSPLNVVVTMEERCVLPPDLQLGDEFLVQSIMVSVERLVSEHITEDTFNKVSSKVVQKVNLSVVYGPLAQLPLLLRDGSEETDTAQCDHNGATPLETETTNLQQLEGLPVDALQDIRGILIHTERFNSWDVQDTKIHVKPLKELWEDFELKQRANRVEMMKRGGKSISSLTFSSWLSSFYEETLLYLEQELERCSTAFPEEYKSLVPKVLVETMSELNSSFVSHVNLATGDAVAETRYVAKGVLDVSFGAVPTSTELQNQHLAALIELHNMTDTFAMKVKHLFSESDRRVLLTTLEAIYSPYETFKVRYVQMERAVLSAAVAGFVFHGATLNGVGEQGIELSETLRRMEESVSQMIELLEEAVERCISLTGGSEIDELVLALDDVMLQYISNLEGTLKSLRTVYGLDNMAHSDASNKDAGLEKREAPRLVDVSEEKWSISQAYQIFRAARYLLGGTSRFEDSLRATLARIGTDFSLPRFGSSMDKSLAGTADENSGVPLGRRPALDIAIIRLTNLPDKSKKLFDLVEQSKDPRFHALPVTSRRVAAFSYRVSKLVYGVLISKFQHPPSDFARLPIWSSEEEQGGRPLASSSAYPQQCVSALAEYLNNFEERLGPRAGGKDETELLAKEWVLKVPVDAISLFMEQLRRIHYITDRGAHQLAADIYCLIRTLVHLSVPIPPFLSTYHACISTPRDQVRDLIKSDEGGKLDLPTAHLVSKIRRIPLD